MKLTDLGREVVLPVTTPAVFFALLLFFVFLQIALFGRIFGLVIALVLAAQLVVFVLPALTRTLMQLLEARSKGKEPPPPVVEFFSWVGNSWTLLPIVHVAILGYLYYRAGQQADATLTYVIACAYVLLLPASLIVLAVTHSALESIRPGAILLLLRRCGSTYLLGPLFVGAALLLYTWLRREVGYPLLVEFVGFYLLFAAFAVFGGMVRPLALHRALDIPEVERLHATEFDAQQELVRTATLNHAYGLISRGNRTAGLDHLLAELRDDADGWYWYLDRMLRWEDNNAGLAFAQHYVHHLLRHGDYVAAVKVMLRCRLINAAFKPLREDLAEAIAAAEECRNEELAKALRD